MNHFSMTLLMVTGIGREARRAGLLQGRTKTGKPFQQGIAQTKPSPRTEDASQFLRLAMFKSETKILRCAASRSAQSDRFHGGIGAAHIGTVLAKRESQPGPMPR